MAAGNSEVAKTTAAVDGMAADRSLIAALMGGRKAMREFRPRHLPKWPAEDEQSYFARVAKAALFHKPTIRRARSMNCGFSCS
jgi:hypothetical protein